jgi:dihydroorotate dehydrogenase electron transfer subunit
MKRVIINNNEIAKNVRELTFEWDDDSHIDPGQFVMIRVRDSVVPLLRRPMSIASAGGGRASVIFKIVGEGTAIMAKKSSGDEIDVDGPYGNSFTPIDGKKIVMVGGGVGIPPLVFYAARNREREIHAILGGASKEDIFGVKELESCGCDVEILTEDGSAGEKGLATHPLTDALNGGAHLIACGPNGMLKAVESICSALGASGEVSIEEKMACGFGVCLGCIVETVNGRRRACHDGPVFKTGVIKWD